MKYIILFLSIAFFFQAMQLRYQAKQIREIQENYVDLGKLTTDYITLDLQLCQK
jgi:hypothetical protein